MINYYLYDDVQNKPFNNAFLQGVEDVLGNFQKKILEGQTEEEVLSYIFDSLGEFIPFDRVGIAVKEGDVLRAQWVKSNLPVKHLKLGYTAKIAKSSLEQVLQMRKPRIIDNLEAYLQINPDSESTRLILKDGIRSNLTFPIYLRDEPYGVVFFASCRPCTYTLEHLQILESVSHGLALVIERTQLGAIRQQSKDQEQVLARIIHDLRSPLGVMVSFSELLNEAADSSNLNASIKDMVGIIQKNARALLELVDDLHEVLTLKRSSLKIKRQPVMIFDFLAELGPNIQALCSKKSILLDFEIDDELSETWSFDPLRLRQVFENLVSNAVKFSREGSKVTIKVWEEEDSLFFAVTDQGVGIPAEDLPKLFHEFGVASTRPTANEKSTGLGLVICKQIIEAHGGDISIQSKLHQGSTLSFFIPRLIDEEDK